MKSWHSSCACNPQAEAQVVANGQQHDALRHVPASIERIARWWTSASQAERFEVLRKSINGDREAPTLKALQIAIYLSEVEAGEVAQG